MIYAYVRVSREHQSGAGQDYEIRNYLEHKGMKADRWVYENVSGTVEVSRRKLGRTISRMRRGDLLICTEISRLGRNMLMIMSILNDCSRRGIEIHTIKDNFDLGNNINSKIIAFAFALAAEIERNLISQRTREALADKKASGVVLGRPKGSFKCRDVVLRNLPEIEALPSEGVSYKDIAMKYGISPNTLRRYLK